MSLLSAKLLDSKTIKLQVSNNFYGGITNLVYLRSENIMTELTINKKKKRKDYTEYFIELNTEICLSKEYEIIIDRAHVFVIKHVHHQPVAQRARGPGAVHIVLDCEMQCRCRLQGLVIAPANCLLKIVRKKFPVQKAVICSLCFAEQGWQNTDAIDA